MTRTPALVSSDRPLVNDSPSTHNSITNTHRRSERGICPMRSDPDRYDYLRLIDRPKIGWPNGARVAFWVSPNVEYYELDPPPNPGHAIWWRPQPDILNYSYRDYGNRVGLWRMIEIMGRYGVRGSVSLSAALCDHIPEA